MKNEHIHKCMHACVRACVCGGVEENCVCKHEEAVYVIRQTHMCDPGQYSLSRSNFNTNHLEDYVMFWHE